jgi:hypothetical protein
MRYFVCCDLCSYYVIDDHTDSCVAGPYARKSDAEYVKDYLNDSKRGASSDGEILDSFY